MATIYDLFKLGIKTLPDENYNEIYNEIDSAGEKITEYSKVLEKPELVLFKIIRLLQFPNGTKSILFLNPHPASISIDVL
jgi:hypothetical protein